MRAVRAEKCQGGALGQRGRAHPHEMEANLILEFMALGFLRSSLCSATPLMRGREKGGVLPCELHLQIISSNPGLSGNIRSRNGSSADQWDGAFFLS